MSLVNKGIDNPESQNTDILVLDPAVVIADYESETGVTLSDEVKNSIGFLVRGINTLRATITADSMQILNLLLTSNTIYDRGFTQPILNALQKRSIPHRTTDLVSTTMDLFGDTM